MGKIRKQPPVKLIAGLIFKNEDCLSKAKSCLIRRFGKLDYESETIPFIYTDYYEKEFGKNLKRKFISFNKLITPDKLPDIKIFTNKLEKKLSQANCRRINIDPGYLELSKLILATTKDYAHRIYLNNGIYAEVTLFYKDRKFCYWEWTYPDFRTGEYLEIFGNIRAIYEEQTRSIR